MSSISFLASDVIHIPQTVYQNRRGPYIERKGIGSVGGARRPRQVCAAVPRQTVVFVPRSRSGHVAREHGDRRSTRKMHGTVTRARFRDVGTRGAVTQGRCMPTQGLPILVVS